VTGFIDDPSVVSWGRVERFAHRVARPRFSDELPKLIGEARQHGPLLAVGAGRSYGDSGLNGGGALIDMRGLDRLVSFDVETGILEAEAGVSLAEILRFAVPRGFFLPVTPGTKFVTLGGAIANDVHGKNHHGAGTIGRWIERIELWRSDGSRQLVKSDDNSGLFAATIGGLGLTGLIARAALRLVPIESAFLEVETTPFGSLAEFFALSATQSERFAHTVAWVDCLAGARGLGRGIFSAANFSRDGGLDPGPPRRRPALPFDLPGFALNRVSIGAFNHLYRLAGRLGAGRRRVAYEPFFYPLDAIGNWNRLYGRRGMFQYQSVVPPAAAEAATAEMLAQISKAGEGSFLVVLKTFGALPSPGLLSFPREGTTLALDFPNRGESTLALLDRLDAVVKEAGGRLYPAKDGRLSGAMFRAGYPELERFAAQLDPGFSSSFWRRVM
jgi:L-gulonolactone oxidase